MPAMRVALYAFWLYCSCPALAAAAHPEPKLPTYVCRRTLRPPVVDGRLSDSIWSRVPVFSDFRLTDGATKPNVRTEFRACWDKMNLYLAFTCFDPDIVATMTERDSPLYDEDCVEAFLSTGGDITRYYEFEFSPRNVAMDASVFPDQSGTDKVVDYGWNCPGLRTAARISGRASGRGGKGQRWTIEIAIPFSRVGRRGRAPAAGEVWRANLYRIQYGGKQPEFICWSPTLVSPPSFHVPARFGRLVFSDSSASRQPPRRASRTHR